MAERRRGKKRKEEFPEKEDKVEKASKDEYAVAKWLKDNVPTKKTKFLGHNVSYFTGTKAVDALMESKWGKPEKEGQEPFFATRDHCIDFLDMMLRHRFFHRAKKVLQEKIVDLELRKKKALKDKKTDDKDKKEKKVKDKKTEDEQGESSHAEGKKPDEGEEERKKKKKVRLDMHLEQVFADTLDAYVWIYDPMPVYYPIIGTLVVLAAILVCLFPLWPASVRTLVYYLSVAGACLLAVIIALAIIRFVLFCAIWVATAGKHHLWILPNLTEDVGFFASFWPLYHYEYKGPKREKEKSEEEEEDNDNAEESEKEDDGDQSGNEDENQEAAGESDSEGSGSQTGRDFEMVNSDELQQDDESGHPKSE